MNPHKIVIPGGSGFLGQALALFFANLGWEVIILSRRTFPNTEMVRYVYWDGETLGDWAKSLEGAHAIVNMAGKSVDCRYTPENKAKILSSRLDSTSILGKAVAECGQAPKVWLNSSSATIYEGTREAPQTEANGTIGDDFSMNVCKQWEAAFFQSETPHTRKVALRSSIVLGKDGEATKILIRLAKLGLGGAQGDGGQYFSWLHIADFVRIVQFLLEEEVEGVVNCCAPHPVTNKELMRLLRAGVGAQYGLPANRFMLEIGALFLRTETELVLKSRRVYPERLLELGYEFKYPKLPEAIDQILRANLAE